jgi:hypothetical protein
MGGRRRVASGRHLLKFWSWLGWIILKTTRIGLAKVNSGNDLRFLYWKACCGAAPPWHYPVEFLAVESAGRPGSTIVGCGAP